jgi:hypothetical protein
MLGVWCGGGGSTVGQVSVLVANNHGMDYT